jgi:AraC-like DNA-binding protein
MNTELKRRRDGYGEAVPAYLTLLLVDLSRLAADIVGDLRIKDEPLLAEVFDVIERRFDEPISLRDIAEATFMTPGHLTTIVRRKTGRTVGEWIAERRMSEARRLLIETDLSIDEIGQRSGYRDPNYFARSFKRAHATTPRQWRNAGRFWPAGRGFT